MSDLHTTSERVHSWADSSIIVMTVILAPQIILRSLSFEGNSAEIWLAALTVVLTTAMVLGGAAGLRRVSPRRLSYQLVASNVSQGVAVVSASARFLCYLILIVLGAGLISGAAGAFYTFGSYIRWVLVGTIVVLALPVLFRLRISSRFVLISAGLGALTITVVIICGLVQEMLGGIDPKMLEIARRQTISAGVNATVNIPRLSGTVAALFPAAIFILISERVFATGTQRRVNIVWLGRAMLTCVIGVVLSLNLTVVFELPGQRLGVPTLSMGAALFGPVGEKLVAVAYVLIGVAVVLVSYARLPKLLREVATDGILPRALGTQDALKPRLFIVGVAATFAALLSTTLLSTQAGAIIFIVAAFLYLGLGCAAMVARSQAILKESVEKTERDLARKNRGVFSFLGCVCVAVFTLVLLTAPLLLFIALVGLAVPALIMLKVRRRIGRVSQVLAPDLTSGRRLPTRIHGVVMVRVLDDPTLRAVTYARAHRLSSLTAVTVDYDSSRTRRLLADWEKAGLPVDLTVLGSPEEATRGQVVDFVHAMRTMHPGDVVTLFYPRISKRSFWARLFSRASFPKIVADLRHEPGVILAEVPYMIEEEADEE